MSARTNLGVALRRAVVVSAVLATALAVSAFRPRTCSTCGVYAGPNLARVIDPYLRQVDVWPEFSAGTCQFEVARGAFVRLERPACSAEVSYRAARGGL